VETTKTIAVTEETFESEVEKSSLPVVVDFWAPWCGPCRIVGPILEDIAVDNEGKVKVAKVNVDENPELAQRFGVRGIPTMMFFKGGDAVGQMVGAASKERIQETIDSII
jgi:thioredoxin 1